jgi:hypothetical protein
VTGHHSGAEFDEFVGLDEPEEDHVDGESTDSMVSAVQLSAFAPPDAAAAADAPPRSSPYIKRMSNAGGTIFYQTRPTAPPPPTVSRGAGGGGALGQLVGSVTGGLPTQERRDILKLSEIYLLYIFCW